MAAEPSVALPIGVSDNLSEQLTAMGLDWSGYARDGDEVYAARWIHERTLLLCRAFRLTRDRFGARADIALQVDREVLAWEELRFTQARDRDGFVASAYAHLPQGLRPHYAREQLHRDLDRFTFGLEAAWELTRPRLELGHGGIAV